MNDSRTAASQVTLRRWRHDDLAPLVRNADNRAIWRNMTDIFPHPYTVADGEEWIARCLVQTPPRDLVIAVAGEFVGVCGFAPGQGVQSNMGTVGYWVGEEHWGHGIATAALAQFLTHVWGSFPVWRLEARVFAWNPASARVLEKNGFSLEGVRRSAIRKAGETTDELIFGLLRGKAT